MMAARRAVLIVDKSENIRSKMIANGRENGAQNYVSYTTVLATFHLSQEIKMVYAIWIEYPKERGIKNVAHNKNNNTVIYNDNIR